MTSYGHGHYIVIKLMKFSLTRKESDKMCGTYNKIFPPLIGVPFAVHLIAHQTRHDVMLAAIKAS